jgi:hypothetical protein
MSPVLRHTRSLCSPAAVLWLGGLLGGCGRPLADAPVVAVPDASSAAWVDRCRDGGEVVVGVRGTGTVVADRCVVEWTFPADPCLTPKALDVAFGLPLRRLPAPHLAAGVDLFVGASEARDVEVFVRRDTGCAEAATAEWTPPGVPAGSSERPSTVNEVRVRRP